MDSANSTIVSISVLKQSSLTLFSVHFREKRFRRQSISYDETKVLFHLRLATLLLLSLVLLVLFPLLPLLLRFIPFQFGVVSAKFSLIVQIRHSRPPLDPIPNRQQNDDFPRTSFLVANKRLYIRVCASVRPWVHGPLRYFFQSAEFKPKSDLTLPNVRDYWPAL